MTPGSFPARGSLAALFALCASLSFTACTTEDLGMMGDDDMFTTLYKSTSFQTCAGCHAPNAPGKTADTEATQDWSTRDTAYSSLKGMASGLMGNFTGCNGVPFLGTTPETSLLVATLDDTVRQNFVLADHTDCNVDAISDMTLKIGGPLAAADLDLLKEWISAGAPDK